MYPEQLPTPRTPLSSDVPRLKWGIRGTGWIAHRFAETLNKNTEQVLHSVVSNSLSRSQEFAATFNVATATDNYQEFLADPEIDVVYIATGHRDHFPDALAAIQAGKNVFVEKPIGLDAQQARELAAEAKKHQVFLAEAFWTLFLPKYDVIRQLIADGVLGKIHTVHASMGEYFESDHRILDPERWGGTMLDMGIYPVSFLSWVLDDVAQVQAQGTLSASGVNAQTQALVLGSQNEVASMHVTLLNETETRAYIAGEKASIFIEGPFYRPGKFTLTKPDMSEPLVWDEPAIDHAGLYHQALRVADCIGQGLKEAPERPMEDSIKALELLDRIREITADPSLPANRQA